MIFNRNTNTSLRKHGKIGSTNNSRLHCGSLLIEMVIATVLLLTIGLVVFRSTVDLLSPRQSVLHQNVSDAYMTFEEAFAARVSYQELTSTTSPWPEFPNTSSTTVEIGRLPGDRPVNGTVIRTRTPDPNNFPAAGGTGTSLTNPAEMETWILESHLTYRIGDETYTKSRTISRTQ